MRLPAVLLLGLLIATGLAGCSEPSSSIQHLLPEAAPQGWRFEEPTARASQEGLQHIRGGDDLGFTARAPVEAWRQTLMREDGGAHMFATVARWDDGASALHTYARIASGIATAATVGCPMTAAAAWIDGNVVLFAMAQGDADKDALDSYMHGDAQHQATWMSPEPCPPLNAPDAPDTGFETADAEGRIVVASAPDGADWSGYYVRSLTGSLRIAVAEDANGQSPAIDHLPHRLPPGPITTQDFLDLCADEPLADVEVHVVHNATNSLVHRAVFGVIPSCD